MNTEREFNIDAPVFATFKEELNAAITVLLSKMREKNSDGGNISIKMSIALASIPIADEETGEIVEAFLPAVAHKIKPSVNITMGESKGVVSGNETALTFSEDGTWNYRRMNQQQSIFD